MFRILFRFALFVALNLIALLGIGLLSCKNDATKAPLKAKDEVEKVQRISKIEITEFGKTTTLKMTYEKNVINIEFQPYKKNVEARIELNKDQQIREIISGTQRIQYMYDENGRKMGIFSDKGMQQIMFNYEGENITSQHNIFGNDTLVSYYYRYENEVPNQVKINGKQSYTRTYDLIYSDVENALSGFNEMVLPAELSGLLGIPAMYGKKYLLKAVRIDTGVTDDEPLQEGYTPKFEEVTFEISKTGKHEAIKLVSDGTRQWSAKITW
ncbi:MAG: hypothetical protein NXI10_00685 [bacterium]|nr:hypothetical protein [bacterium]